AHRRRLVAGLVRAIASERPDDDDAHHRLAWIPLACALHKPMVRPGGHARHPYSEPERISLPAPCRTQRASHMVSRASACAKFTRSAATTVALLRLGSATIHQKRLGSSPQDTGRE